MATTTRPALLTWTTVAPVAAMLLLALTWGRDPGPVLVVVVAAALIVTLMASGGPDTASLPCDTVFAAVMITFNGILGLSVLLGAVRHGVVAFDREAPARRWPPCSPSP